MASVQEMKDALEAERGHFVELSERALDAIATQLSLSSWVLGAMAVVVATLGIFGWAAVRRAAIKRAESLAKRRVKTYLCSDEFHALVRTKIEEYTRENWENRIVSTALDRSDKSNVENSPFPTADKKGDAK